MECLTCSILLHGMVDIEVGVGIWIIGWIHIHIPNEVNARDEIVKNALKDS